MLLKTSGMQRRRRSTRCAGSPASRPACCGRTSSTPPPPHGLLALHGSSPDVGVVGYSLGGGMGWLARSHGLQTNSVTAIELVTADGELVAHRRASTSPSCSGRCAAAAATSASSPRSSSSCYPITEVYAGMHDLGLGARRARADGAGPSGRPTAPDDVTTSFRIMQIPPLPEIPELAPRPLDRR